MSLKRPILSKLALYNYNSIKPSTSNIFNIIGIIIIIFIVSLIIYKYNLNKTRNKENIRRNTYHKLNKLWIKADQMCNLITK
jgi:hypothetical protein